MIKFSRNLNRRGVVNVIKISELCSVFDVSGASYRLVVCIIFCVMAPLIRARGKE